MPSKKFHLDSNAGVMMIVDYSTNMAVVSNPLSYLNQIVFHSGLDYLQIRGSVKLNSVSFPSIKRIYLRWDDTKC